MDEADLDQFDQLYVISDLHVGGLPGLRRPPDVPAETRPQMFAQALRLEALLDHLAATPGRVLLVIAGDFIDGLPTLPPGRYVHVDDATSHLRAVVADPGFAPVFAGLGRFLAAHDHSVVVLLGNHDLELALEPVQRVLAGLLGGGDLRFYTEGAGFACVVDGRRIYVTHGNEADPWNHVDHEQLRRARHRQWLGLPFYAQDWEPNAGTALVVDVMNAVKRAFPFVDLLKPEMSAVLPAVAAIAPAELRRLVDAGTVATQRAKAAVGPPIVLGPDGGAPVALPEAGELLRKATSTGWTQGDDEVAALWARVDASGTAAPSSLGTLGPVDALRRWFGVDDPKEALRRALVAWVDNAGTFEPTAPDEVCRGVLSQVGTGFSVVVTGHTHLPRWMASDLRPGITYLNTGTWARLLRLRRASLDSAATFAPVYDVLAAGDMTVLDQSDLLLDATFTAHVGDGAVELLRVSGVTDGGGHATGTPLTLRPMDFTNWRKETA